MTGVLVDSNVLIDVLYDDPVWGDRSSLALASAADGAVLVLNPIVYAEISISYERVEDLEEALSTPAFRREPLPYAAAFLAGKAFLSYRRSGGSRLSPLPDFFIGAHAAIGGYPLLTRDGARYRTYFPTVELLTP
ncbi:MAG: type II toxin-antitoxin system VapC family toxin [Cyanobacteria bacterium REEB65]|nr:type II toxin-antitoxin system VapC family toxin [Cyanobacteria bacterium REEB65]